MNWEGDDRPPPLHLRLGEAVWLLPRMWRVFGSTRALGPADGPPALVIPGFVAHDRTTEPLRKALADLGMAIDEGTLYPLLRRLETQGLLVSEWREEDKRNKRFYRLSPVGKQLLKQLLAEWQHMNQSIDRIL